MNCFGVAVLRVLNQEHHQERNNGCSGVDDQLPRVGKMKSGPGNEPDGDDDHSSSKCPGAAEHCGGTVREDAECIADNAKEPPRLFVFFRVLGWSLVHGYHFKFARNVAIGGMRSKMSRLPKHEIDFSTELRKTCLRIHAAF